MSYDIFISYSKEDKLTAEAICKELETSGVRCWIAPRDISEGDDWTAAIIGGMNQCQVMVMVFSGSTNSSSHVHREIGHAFNRGLTVIPFRVEETAASDRFQYYLDSVQWLNAFPPPVEQYLPRLTERVNKLLAKLRTGSDPELSGKTRETTVRAPGLTPEVARERIAPPAPPSVLATPGSPVLQGNGSQHARERDRSASQPPAGSGRSKVVLLALTAAVIASAGTAWVLSMMGHFGPRGQEVVHSSPPESSTALSSSAPPAPSVSPAVSKATVRASLPVETYSAPPSITPVATSQATPVPPPVEVTMLAPRPSPPIAPDNSSAGRAAKRGTDFTNGAGQNMVWIGTLGIWVAAHETTQGQFQRVLRTNPSAFRSADRPVDSVTWYDAVRYCDSLTQMEQSAGSLPAGFQYRLPKDREWSVFAEGAEISQAVHSRSKSQGSSEVGSRGGNRYGLYDILGNVWEWCLDDYSPSMDSAAVRAQLPDLSRGGKVLRGGSWSTSSSSVMLRIDTHGSDRPGEVSNTDGFRVVLAPAP